jgi:hypothetical protein
LDSPAFHLRPIRGELSGFATKLNGFDPLDAQIPALLRSLAACAAESQLHAAVNESGLADSRRFAPCLFALRARP